MLFFVRLIFQAPFFSLFVCECFAVPPSPVPSRYRVRPSCVGRALGIIWGEGSGQISQPLTSVMIIEGFKMEMLNQLLCSAKFGLSHSMTQGLR